MSFFSLSKIFWALVAPANLLVWLPLLALYFHWHKHKSLARFTTVIALVYGLSILAYPWGDWLMEPLEKAYSQPQKIPQIDGIIVLGGGEDYLSSITHHKLQLNEAGERLIEVIPIAKAHPQIPLIYSGGSGHLLVQNHKLAQWVKAFWLSQGVKEAQIKLESTSRNTWENLVNVQRLYLKPQGLYLLVTSAFHMPRAMGIAQKLGIQAIAYPVDFRTYGVQNRYWDFRLLEHLKVLDKAVHEYLGLVIYYLTGKSTHLLP